MNKVPKLRFPEFSGEWEEKKIKTVSTLKGGYAFKSDKFLSEKSLYQVIKMGNVYQNNLLIDKNPSYLSEISEREKEYLLKNEDILITLTGTVGKRDFGYSYQITDEKNLLLNQRLALLRSNNDNSNSKFLRYIILKNQFLDQFFESSTGGTGNQANVSIKNIEDFIITIPLLSEQQEIASFLSSIDSKIEKLEKKKELWEQYKKGMVQKIFSQELRFKDENGEDYPEWEEKALGDIGETFNGLTGKTKEDFGSGKPYITYKSIFDSNKINLTRLEYVNISDNENQNIVQYGDIFFTTSSETPNEIGMTSVLLDNVESCYLNSFCFGFRLKNKSKVSPNFMRFYLRSERIRDKIIILAQGSTRYNLSKIELMKLCLNIPSFLEQKQIADFLSSIDSKIEAVDKKLTGLKEFKNGLLQQMFI